MTDDSSPADWSRGVRRVSVMGGLVFDMPVVV